MMFFRSCKFAKIFSIEKKTCKRKILMILCIVLKPSIIYINIIYNLFKHIVRKIRKFFLCCQCRVFYLDHSWIQSQKKNQTEENAKVVDAGWGTKLLQFLAAPEILHKDDLNKRMNRRMDTQRNGFFGKMDDHPVHTIPNHHSSKMDVLSKTFLRIILSA